MSISDLLGSISTLQLHTYIGAGLSRVINSSNRDFGIHETLVPRCAFCRVFQCNQCGGAGCGSNGDRGFGNKECCPNGIVTYQGDCAHTGSAPCVITDDGRLFPGSDDRTCRTISPCTPRPVRTCYATFQTIAVSAETAPAAPPGCPARSSSALHVAEIQPAAPPPGPATTPAPVPTPAPVSPTPGAMSFGIGLTLVFEIYSTWLTYTH